MPGIGLVIRQIALEMLNILRKPKLFSMVASPMTACYCAKRQLAHNVVFPTLSVPAETGSFPVVVFYDYINIIIDDIA